MQTEFSSALFVRCKELCWSFASKDASIFVGVLRKKKHFAVFASLPSFQDLSKPWTCVVRGVCVRLHKKVGLLVNLASRLLFFLEKKRAKVEPNNQEHT